MAKPPLNGVAETEYTKSHLRCPLSKISVPIYAQHISYIIVQTSYAPAASALLFLYFRLIFCDIIIKNHLCRVIWHEVIFICTAVLLSHL